MSRLHTAVVSAALLGSVAAVYVATPLLAPTSPFRRLASDTAGELSPLLFALAGLLGIYGVFRAWHGRRTLVGVIPYTFVAAAGFVIGGASNPPHTSAYSVSDRVVVSALALALAGVAWYAGALGRRLARGEHSRSTSEDQRSASV
jgi:hypothetical protein